MRERPPLRTLAAFAVAALALATAALVYGHPSLPLPKPPGSRPALSGYYDGLRVQELQVESASAAWAWVVRPAGGAELVATADGGRSWRRLTSPAGQDEVYGLQLLDARHAVAQLAQGLATTDDAGQTWRSAGLPPGFKFGLGAHFLTPEEGWYQDLTAYPQQVAQPTSLWWTEDGGAHWSESWHVDASQPEAGALPLSGGKRVLGFANASRGWLTLASEGRSRLLETVDGGRTWTPVALPLREAPENVLLQRLNDGRPVLLVATGSAWSALASRDGGVTWEPPRTLPAGTGLARAAFVDERHWAFAVGTRLAVTGDGGRSWKQIRPALPAAITGLGDLWLDTAGGGWATARDVDGETVVLTTSDGGGHWGLSRVPQLPPAAS